VLVGVSSGQYLWVYLRLGLCVMVLQRDHRHSKSSALLGGSAHSMTVPHAMWATKADADCHKVKCIFKSS
jgi:hypothetical protein